MKLKSTVIALVAIMASSLVSSAQVVSKDSINSLKQQKEALELGKQLNDHKLKLAKIENSLEKQSGDMRKAQENAQKSADENAEIATRLSNDASDKKLARKSRKAARSAERYAKEARKEASNLESLQKEIDDLKKEIAAEEEKLASMPALSSRGASNNQ